MSTLCTYKAMNFKLFCFICCRLYENKKELYVIYFYFYIQTKYNGGI